MLYIFALPRPGYGYAPGDEVTDEFAASHPGTCLPAPVWGKPAGDQPAEPVDKETDHE